MNSDHVDLKKKILELKKKKNAVILAHYYQEADIQDIADFVGDSLGLSQQAASTTADIIVFAGVHFMAETAKILNPRKKVLLPDLNAGCSLAESCPPEKFQSFIEKNPGHVVVSYINCSAGVKAMSDIVCTSANAVQVVNSIPADRQIIFAPDKNLGSYVMNKTQRPMLLWDGVCIVHEVFSIKKIVDLLVKHPEATIVAHPESTGELLKKADFVGSTSAMIDFIERDHGTKYIIATEAGILYHMRNRVPHKTLIPAPASENNSCACSECPYMKLNTLAKLYDCLLNENPEIIIPEDILIRALKPLNRMLEISKQKQQQFV